MTRNGPVWSTESPLLNPGQGKLGRSVCNANRGHTKNTPTIDDIFCVRTVNQMYVVELYNVVYVPAQYASSEARCREASWVTS